MAFGIGLKGVESTGVVADELVLGVNPVVGLLLPITLKDADPSNCTEAGVSNTTGVATVMEVKSVGVAEVD